MALRNNTTTSTLPIGRFEPLDDSNNIIEDTTFSSAVERSVDGLEEMGYQCVDGEPDVIIVLRQTKGRLGPDKMVNGVMYAYNGPIPIQDIVNDLNRQL